VIKIRYSKLARNDLKDIKKYISNELSNPTAAQRVINNIAKRIRGLTQFPLMGAPLNVGDEAYADLRILVCGNYLAFYRPQGETIFIDRILYGRRDYLAILLGDVTDEDMK
jgi:addiction module RelE/StbE family toxin